MQRWLGRRDGVAMETVMKTYRQGLGCDWLSFTQRGEEEPPREAGSARTPRARP